MKYNVEILPAAWEDLKKIEDWYLINFDVETAIKVSDHILDGIERLGDFPDSGSRAPDDWLNEQGYRMVISGKHVSIYRVIKDIVYIYHISDTRTEYTKLFKLGRSWSVDTGRKGFLFIEKQHRFFRIFL